MAGIFPLLVRSENFDTAANVSWPLTKSDEPDIPLVAFVRDDEQGQRKFVTWAAVKKKGHTVRDVEAVARKSLLNRTQRPGWEPLNIPFGQGEVTVLVRRGDEFIAGDILDKELLKNAETYFSSQQLFVGLPTQAFMIAADDGVYIHDLVIQTMEQARAQGQEPLTARIFCTEAGEVTGIAEFEDEEVGTPVARPPAALYHVDGKNALWFSLRPDGADALCRVMETEFNDYGASLSGWEGFQGVIIFNLEPGSVALSRAERQQVIGLAAALTEKAAQYSWRSPYGDSVSVTVQFPPSDAPELESAAAPLAAEPESALESASAPVAAAPSPPPAKGKRFKFTTKGDVRQPTQTKITSGRPATASATGVRLRTAKTPGPSSTQGRVAPAEAGPLVPVTVKELRRLIRNRLDMAVWSMRLWYTAMIIGLLIFGFVAIAVMPKAARATVQAAAQAAADADAKAKAEAAKKRPPPVVVEDEAAAADGSDEEEPAAPPKRPKAKKPAVEGENGGEENEPAEPAPAKKRASTKRPSHPAPVPAKANGKTTAKTTTKPAEPAKPEPAKADTAAAEAAVAAAQKVGFFVLAGMALASILVFAMEELVLIAGLKSLKGWARGLGILQSVVFSLSIAFLPFGAFMLLGLTDGGTAHLFAEAKRLRRANQLKG